MAGVRAAVRRPRRGTPPLEDSPGLIGRGIGRERPVAAYFWNIASRTLNDAIGPGELRGAALEASSNFMFDYIDAISDELAAAYHVERDRWVRSAAAIRAETVREILDGG